MRHRQARGMVTLTVVWAIAIASVIVAATQVLAFRQATIGRETLSRTQARWAARAGVETMIAIMEWHTQNPDERDPQAMVRDLEANAFGEIETGTWDIRHFIDGQEWAGPLDEHSKLNVNLASKAVLQNVPNMTMDVVDSILDWRDQDDQVQALGAESSYYRNRGFSYAPRNGDIRSIAELELVAGGWPQYVRGEDWNLNGRLDPNENDAKRSLPDDRPDGKLDGGWSSVLTAASRASPNGVSGNPRINLARTSPEELMERTGVDNQQASALITYARGANASMGQLLATPLGQLSNRRGAAPSNPGGSSATTGRSTVGRSGGATTPTSGGVKSLDPGQLRSVMNECTIVDSRGTTNAIAGKVNLNTASRTLLREVMLLEPRFAESILTRRSGRPEGITSLADLVDLPGVSQAQLITLAQSADVTSSVYTIASRGRSSGSGAEAEIVVMVDRSTLPAQILEYREP